MYRALIVEDEDLMRGYLAEKLNELCPEWEAAATAADGMEAVEKLAHGRFDAVITDIRMPGMDGLELARYIRRTDTEMPILVLSGYDEFDYARAAVRLNVFDYLLKPLNEDELASALTAMAEQAAARRQTADGTLLAEALQGDAEAERALLLQHAPCALALLSPAYLPTDRKRGERVASLADDA
ncbi:MAG: response regulator, partial [Eubacteriales bacterium]|nr:response regulator [Eubacteriales bacterium]